VLCDPGDEVARRRVLVDEAEPLTGDLVLGVDVLLRIGDEDLAAQVLDSEGA
jgi:hypothetical protein